MRVAAYLRVSTDRQAEEGLGLELQEQAIRSWAKANKHRVVSVLVDEGVSGAKELDHRPGLADALDLVREGNADAVVVYRLDRLARDLVLQEQLLAEFRRLGGEVCSTSAAEAGYLSDDPDDPSRKLIRQILGAVSEYERAMIALRLRSGRRRKAEKGGYAYGSPAFGFRAEDKGLEADQDEQQAIARMQALHEAGSSLRQICAALAEEGYTAKRGGPWHPNTVARVLRRAAA